MLFQLLKLYQIFNSVEQNERSYLAIRKDYATSLVRNNLEARPHSVWNHVDLITAIEEAGATNSVDCSYSDPKSSLLRIGILAFILGAIFERNTYFITGHDWTSGVLEIVFPTNKKNTKDRPHR
jgi:hypothetical protein